MRPSSGEKLLYLCYAGICHSVWVASGQTPPIQCDKYQRSKDTAVLFNIFIYL